MGGLEITWRKEDCFLFDPENSAVAASLRRFSLACMIIFLITLGMRQDPLIAARIGGVLSLLFALLLLIGRSDGAFRRGGTARAISIITGTATLNVAERSRAWLSSWLSALSIGFSLIALALHIAA